MNRIHSEEYFERRVLYDGMNYNLNGRDFVPVSDVDGLMDCHGKAWILYECKFADNLPPIGQKILIERLINNISGTVPAVALICGHGNENPVYLCNTIVTAYYSAGVGWKYYGKDFSRRFTAKELSDLFIRRHAPEMLIRKGDEADEHKYPA